jgi:hypothetical protein
MASGRDVLSRLKKHPVSGNGSIPMSRPGGPMGRKVVNWPNGGIKKKGRAA